MLASLFHVLRQCLQFLHRPGALTSSVALSFRNRVPRPIPVPSTCSHRCSYPYACPPFGIWLHSTVCASGAEYAPIFLSAPLSLCRDKYEAVLTPKTELSRDGSPPTPGSSAGAYNSDATYGRCLFGQDTRDLAGSEPIVTRRRDAEAAFSSVA